MKAGTIGASLVAGSGAVLSSLCCLLPLTVIVLGLGSGAFMAVTMRYRWLLIPRACWRSPRDFSSTLASGDGATRSAAGWRAAGSRAILLCERDRRRLDRAGPIPRSHRESPGPTGGRWPFRRWTRYERDGREVMAMTPWPRFGLALLFLLLVAHATPAAPSTVVLSVEGMTRGT